MKASSDLSNSLVLGASIDSRQEQSGFLFLTTTTSMILVRSRYAFPFSSALNRLATLILSMFTISPSLVHTRPFAPFLHNLSLVENGLSHARQTFFRMWHVLMFAWLFVLTFCAPSSWPDPDLGGEGDAHDHDTEVKTLTEMAANANTNMEVDAGALMPVVAREFPREKMTALPLRFAMTCYRANGGRIITPGSSPETEGIGIPPGSMFAMAACPGIIGHGVVIDGIVRVCESFYADAQPNSFVPMAVKTDATGLKWVIGDNPATTGPCMPTTSLMKRASDVYRDANPLTLYNYHAMMEAMDHTSDSGFWQSLYPVLEKVERNYGMYGLLHDNTVLSLGEAAGPDIEPNLEERRPRRDHGGFLDACYTPQSKAAGKVRWTAIGVTTRVRTAHTFEITKKILLPVGRMTEVINRSWVLRLGGVCTMVTLSVVQAIAKAWANTCEPNMPVIHIFKSEKVVVVSTAPGTLIRPVRTKVIERRFVAEGPYVDTVAVYHSDTMSFCGINFPTPENEPEQFFALATLTVPFAAWTTEPRPNLGLQMLRQSMCTKPIMGDATITSMTDSRPLVATDWMDALTDGLKDPLIPVPGRSVTIAFVNMYMNTEDGCIVSREWAMSGLMAWSGVINYHLPTDAGYVRPGTVLKDQKWWRPAIEGVVLSTETTKTGDPYAIIYVTAKGPMVGDKIATAHGLKMTITQMLTNEEMPAIVEESTNRPFKPNVLISTKNLTRGIGGQIREMAAATNRFASIEAFRSLQEPTGAQVFTFEDQKAVAPRIPSGVVLVNGKPVVMEEKDWSRRTVKASYGIAHVLQLRHIAALKHHYMSAPVRSILIPKGRMRGGTARMGEGEILATLMQNMPSVVRDAMLASDGVITVKCSVCHKLALNCDCPNPKPPTTEIVTRYWTVVLDVYMTVGSLNSAEGKAICLTYLTRT